MNDRIRELAAEILRLRGEPARDDEHFAFAFVRHLFLSQMQRAEKAEAALAEAVALRPPDNTAKLYEELRSITDGNSESFTHKDAVQYLTDVLAQPKQEFVAWVGLTDEEIKDIVGRNDSGGIGAYTRKLFKQIEDKLREKNR